MYMVTPFRKREINRTQYESILKSAYELCLYIEQTVDSFSRPCKYSIGIDLKDCSREILKLVVRANARHNKKVILLKLRAEIKEMKVLLSLCNDIMAFANIVSFEHAMCLVTEIARQNEIWLISQHQRQSRNRPNSSKG